MTKPIISHQIRKELREKYIALKFLKEEIMGLELKLLIQLREEDREIVHKTNSFEPFSKDVKGVPAKYRKESIKTTPKVDLDELKRLLEEVD